LVGAAKDANKRAKTTAAKRAVRDRREFVVLINAGLDVKSSVNERSPVPWAASIASGCAA
jgi:hypothetical protein